MNIHNERLYHIGITPAQGARAAIICGDPGRVESIAELCDGCAPLASNREYTSFEADLGDERILVMSHGIGGPSTAICIEELYMAGVRTIIRVGTCGGMAKTVKSGDLVIASSAIRAEGTSREYLPIEFPAVADFDVTEALRDEARALSLPYHVGVVHCKDSFYGQHSPERMPVAGELLSKWKAWIAGGALASEMETAALFCVSASLGIRSGAVLRALWNQETGDAPKSPDVSETSDITDSVIAPDIPSDELSAACTAVGAMRRLLN